MDVTLFLYQYHLTNLAKEDAYCKQPRKSRCIDFYLARNSWCLQDALFVFTGYSDFQKLVLGVIKAPFVKSKTNEISHWDCKHIMKILIIAWSVYY